MEIYLDHFLAPLDTYPQFTLLSFLTLKKHLDNNYMSDWFCRSWLTNLVLNSVLIIQYLLYGLTKENCCHIPFCVIFVKTKKGPSYYNRSRSYKSPEEGTYRTLQLINFCCSTFTVLKVAILVIQAYYSDLSFKIVVCIDGTRK